VVYTDELLESLRYEGDPVPDRLVADLAKGGETDRVNAVLGHYMRSSAGPSTDLPSELAAWFTATAQLPGGTDGARLDRASQVFLQDGLAISLVLSTASLIECYACRKGVQVLTFTYRLGQNAYRRVGETAQYVLDVMAPDGLSGAGSGIAAIQKVRLMHAAIRYLIQQSGRWDEMRLGRPINQEDLLGTLLTFAITPIYGLKKLGMSLPVQEAEDYFYAWRVIGQMMGIRPEIIPIDVAAGRQLQRQIFARQQAPSPEGVVMTRALLQMQAHLTPGRFFDGVIPALARRLVGDRVADWMAVPHSPWEWVVKHEAAVGGLIDRWMRRSSLLRRVVDHVALRLMSRQSITMAGYQRAAFRIPTRLRAAWQLPAVPDDRFT
jgi:hypothetical protein